MKFVVDAQLPPQLANWLREKGHEARSVREIGLRDAKDNAIWALAVTEDLVIVTKDGDFASLTVTRSGPQVLWVRTGNLVNRLLFARFEPHGPKSAVTSSRAPAWLN